MINLDQFPSIADATCFLNEVFDLKEIDFSFEREISLKQLSAMGFNPLILVDEQTQLDPIAMEILLPQKKFSSQTLLSLFPQSPLRKNGKIAMFLRPSDIEKIQREYNNFYTDTQGQDLVKALEKSSSTNQHITRLSTFIKKENGIDKIVIAKPLQVPAQVTLEHPGTDSLETNNQIKLTRESLLSFAKTVSKEKLEEAQKVTSQYFTNLAQIIGYNISKAPVKEETVAQHSLREAALLGWMVGKGRNRGDKLEMTRHELWDELKLTGLKAFDFESKTVSKNGHDISPTPKSFFSKQKIFKFR